MLSDEEKEAIEYIKNCLDDEYDFKNATRQKDKEAHNIILNLIEKQSKEIEELYQDNLTLIQEINKKWEDKIKAKIEEVDYKMIAHSDVREAVKQVLESLLEKEE